MYKMECLVPVEVGITKHPFFQAGESKKVAILETPRKIAHTHLLPSSLVNLYKAYPPDVEFHDPGKEWTILSETEVLERYKMYLEKGQNRVVDVALRYSGLGWVQTCTYDPTTGLAATTWDGGGNGFDREENYKAKLCRGDDSTSVPFDEWWASRP